MALPQRRVFISLLSCLCCLIFSFAQNVSWLLCLRIFGSEGPLIVPLASIIIWIVLCVMRLLVFFAGRGFAREVNVKAVKRSFHLIGFLEALGQTAEAFALSQMMALEAKENDAATRSSKDFSFSSSSSPSSTASPSPLPPSYIGDGPGRVFLILTISLQHALIVFVFAFTLAADLNFHKFFSRKAILGVACIALGCVIQLGSSYLSTGQSAAYDRQIFVATLLLISQMPNAVSTLLQQETFTPRRLNVIHMLAGCAGYKVLWSILLLPVNCARGFSDIAPINLFRAFANFVLCGLNVPRSLHPPESETSPDITPLHRQTTRHHGFCKHAASMILWLVGSALAAQIAQIVMTRRNSYQACAITVLAIPTSLLLFISTPLLNTLIGQDLARVVIGTKRDSETGLTVAIICTMMVLVGSSLYRLDPENKMEEAFVFSSEGRHVSTIADATHHESESIITRHLRQKEEEHNPSPPPPTLRMDSVEERNVGSDAFPLVQFSATHSNDDHVVQVSERNLSRRAEQQQLVNGIVEEEESSRPFLFPAALAGFVRPALMNPWSGWITCEYTNYKRDIDRAADQTQLQHHGMPMPQPDTNTATHQNRGRGDDDRRSRAAELSPRYTFWRQYTTHHEERLGTFERTLHSLYSSFIARGQSEATMN